MKRVKMFISGVVALALLCFFSAPMVQAQVGALADTTHGVKLNASAVAVGPPPGFVLSRTGGKVEGPVVLRDAGVNFDTLGFNYNINLLEEPVIGTDCDETTIGTLSTYTPAENLAFGELFVVGKDVPEPGLNLFGEFFAQIKIKPGKSSFKSVAGWAEIVVDGAPGPDPDGMSKKFGVKGKENTLEKLGLECNLGPAP